MVMRSMTTAPAPVSEDAADLAAWNREHDEAAFGRLAERHHGSILGTCQRILGSGQSADDAAQAVLVLLSRKASTIRLPGNLPGWLHRCTVMACRQVIRDEQSRRRGEERVMATANAEQPPP